MDAEKILEIGKHLTEVIDELYWVNMSEFCTSVQDSKEFERQQNESKDYLEILIGQALSNNLK